MEVEFIEQEVRVRCNHETRTEYYEREQMNKDGNEKYDHWNKNSIDELNSRMETTEDWIRPGV